MGFFLKFALNTLRVSIKVTIYYVPNLTAVVVGNLCILFYRENLFLFVVSSSLTSNSAN